MSSRSESAVSARRHLALLAAVILLVILWCWVTGAYGQSPSPDVVRVEEDWELVLGEPEPDSDSPQVTCTMSPVANLGSLYAALELNHRSLPEFVAGGLQWQLWNGETLLASRSSERSSLDQAGETVRWTQRMSLGGGQCEVEVVNGTSVSWGSFGGGDMKLSVSTALTNLNGYSPSVSAANSSVGFAANRVDRLVLKAVRLYSAQGLLSSDTTERVVYPR